MGVKYPPGHGAHGLHVCQVNQVIVMSWSSKAMSALIVITMSLLSSRWLASKCRVTAIVRLVIVKVIVCKVDAVSVRIGIAVKVMVNAIHLGLHLGELGAVGVRVSRCSTIGRLLLLTFLVEV